MRINKKITEISMNESIFGEFQYFIKRINGYRDSGKLPSGESIEDLEQRFRIQVVNGLVITEPGAQEIAMEILLSDLSEQEQRGHLMTLRKTGNTEFKLKKAKPKVLKKTESVDQKRERALNLFVKTLTKAGLKIQRQSLGVKMLYAEHELKSFDYDDLRDLKLLFVNTIKISGHAKKADPVKLANVFKQVFANALA